MDPRAGIEHGADHQDHGGIADSRRDTGHDRRGEGAALIAPLLIAAALLGQVNPLEDARQAVALERWDTAIPILEAWTKSYPDASEARDLLLYSLQARAKRELDQEKYPAAMLDLDRAAQIDPTNRSIRNNLIAAYSITARHLMKEGDTEGAEQAFRDALALDTTRRDARRSLASVMVMRGRDMEGGGRFLEALNFYKRALDIDTASIEANLLLGQLYYTREDFELARFHLRRARALTTTRIQGLDDLLSRVDKEFEVTRTYQTYEMDGFLVRYEGGARPDLFYQVLPILKEARDRATRVLERSVHRPLSVIIYAGEGIRRAAEAPDWAVGFYDGKIRLREAEMSAPTDYLTRVIRHEVGHAVIEELAPGRVPSWIHEGLAKYFEIDRWDPLQDANYLVQAIQARRTMPLKDLDVPFAKLPAGSDIRLAYAEAAAAIRYLGINHGDRALSDLVALLAAGRSATQAVDSVTFYDMPTFQKRVEDWVIWENLRK